MDQALSTSAPSTDVPAGAHLLVGGFTAEMGGTAPGLGSYRWTADSSDQVELTAFPGIELLSPSWVEFHPTQPRAYAVTESEPAVIAAMELAEDGNLRLINTAAIQGDAACHVAFTTDLTHLVVANYGDGSVASFAINEDGSVSDQRGHRALTGSGPDPERQDHSHAHHIVVDGSGFWVVDLGADEVRWMSLDDRGAIIDHERVIALPPGFGPRHLILTGDHMIVAGELSAQVWLGRRHRDSYQEVAVVSSTGRTPTAENRIYPSGIGICEDQVLIANRGSDTVGVLALDREHDQLELIEEFSTGAWPRDLKVINHRLWISAQQGNEVLTYVRDSAGHWQPDFAFPAPSPACVTIKHPTSAS